MADRIEEIMMKAYAQGIHEDVFNAVNEIQHEYLHDLADAYEVAFQQTMSRYEQSDSKN